MSAIFGIMDVFVAVIEWESDRDVDVIVAASEHEAQKAAVSAVRESMAATVETYDPDGCREFVLGDVPFEMLTAEEWLTSLREKTTVPWVTITQHTIPIQ